MKQRMHIFLADEHGATVVEYALIILATATALIAATPQMGKKLLNIFNSLLSLWTF